MLLSNACISNGILFTDKKLLHKYNDFDAQLLTIYVLHILIGIADNYKSPISYLSGFNTLGTIFQFHQATHIYLK